MEDKVIKMTRNQLAHFLHIPEVDLQNMLQKHGLVEQRKTFFFWIGFLWVCFWCLMNQKVRHKDRQLKYSELFGKLFKLNLFSDRLSMIPSAFFRDLLTQIEPALKQLGSPKKRNQLNCLFRSILIEDASVFHLDKRLVNAFSRIPGSQSVGAKLYFGISYLGHPQSQVSIQSAKTADVKQDTIGAPGSLELKDRGWFSMKHFVDLKNEGRYFISRIQNQFNPQIVGISTGSSDWKGCRFQDCNWEGYTEVDLEVKPYRGKETVYRLKNGKVFTLRMTGKLKGKQWHWYVYELPRVKDLSFDNIHQLYRIRWRIEESFREIKSGLGGDHLRLRHDVSVENHLLMLVITYLVLKGYLALLASVHRRSNSGLVLDTILVGTVGAKFLELVELISSDSKLTKRKLKEASKDFLKVAYSSDRARSGRQKNVGKVLTKFEEN